MDRASPDEPESIMQDASEDEKPQVNEYAGARYSDPGQEQS